MQEDGVWRTIRGRRIFIKAGQSLKDAIKESLNKSKNNYLKKEKDLKKMSEEFKNNQFMVTKELYKKIEEIENNENLTENQKNGRIGNLKHEIKLKEDELREKISQKYGYKSEETFSDTFSYKDENGFYELDKSFVKEIQNDEKTIKSFYEKTKNHKFYNQDIEEKALNEYFNVYHLNDKDRTDSFIDFDKISQKENLKLSQSPYSSSIYLIKDDEYIDWDYKPTGSYRMADHWNFESRGKIHCKIKNNEEYNQDYMICKWNGNSYEVVKKYE